MRVTVQLEKDMLESEVLGMKVERKTGVGIAGHVVGTVVSYDPATGMTVVEVDESVNTKQ